MEIINSKKPYEAPLTKAIEAKVRRVLCDSRLEGKDTEKFNYSNRHYGDDDFTDYQ